jgi:sulfide:quinone oxidoreductase
MQLKPVNENFLVAGQLDPNDLAAIAAQGIRTLICNRPDNEQPGQPACAEISKRAAGLGITTHYLPVVHTSIDSRAVRSFTALLQTENAPVLAWCRSGQRSLVLWCLSRIQLGDDHATVLAQAKNLGFDFSNLPAAFAGVIAELTSSSGNQPPA